MSYPMKTLHRALVAIDFSDKTDDVVQWALTLASQHEAQLVLVHIANPDPDFVGYGPGPQSIRDHTADGFHDERSRLEELAQSLTNAGITVRWHCLQGPVIEALIRKASEDDVDLIVIGSHGHGELYRAVLGSTSEGVVLQADCPVMVVPTRR